MKKNIFIIIFWQIIYSISANSQGLPMHRYNPYSVYVLDKVASAPSIAYSFRKLRKNYAGRACQVRGGTTGVIFDLDFDATGFVSQSSNCYVTTAGTGYSLGQTVPFSTILASDPTMYVVQMYDQSLNGWNAIQPTTSKQPSLAFNWSGNPKISFFCNGSTGLYVAKGLTQIVNSNGINGTLFLSIYNTNNTVGVLSFGGRSSTDWRWSFHLNWSDGNIYFDAGEVCCAAYRSYVNTNNAWHQFTFVRSTSQKIIVKAGAQTVWPQTATGTFSGSSAYWGVGAIPPDSHNTSSFTSGFFGYIIEYIVFPTSMGSTEYNFIGNNERLVFDLP